MQKPTKYFTTKKLILTVFDLASTILAGFLSAWIFYSSLKASLMQNFKDVWFLYPAIAAPIFIFFGFYEQMWAYAGVNQYLLLVAGAISHTVVLLIIMQLSNKRLHFAVYLIYFFLLSAALLSIRVFYRLYAAGRDKKRAVRTWEYSSKGEKIKDNINVLVIGAGAAGRQIIEELQSRQRIRIPVALVDDNPLTHGFRNHGVPVMGDRNDIPAIVEKLKVDEIILAIPGAPAKEVKQILNICTTTNAKVRTVPFLPQILHGNVSLTDVRDVNIEDLLGREPVDIDLDGVAKKIDGKTVLVTGGGGSIGSELVRQIASFAPERILIFDIYENTSYQLFRKLEAKYGSKLKQDVLIGSVRDLQRLEEVFKQYKPDIVFHAAAHKHVPLMEVSRHDAVKNNILGTYKTALMAGKYKAESFILISTDKAVNPTNVMGASKRFAELEVAALNKIFPDTVYSAVRFGNVLGSAGSVIPIFERQIREEGRVTVTHKDIVRYFMTIPEAASLVMQASVLAKGGEIFVLDMGDPVKLDNLARQMIRLTGLIPDVDVKVEYIGLRPGEKMFEELYSNIESFEKTAHDKIFLLSQKGDRAHLQKELYDLIELIDSEKESLTDFADQVLDLMFKEEGESISESDLPPIPKMH